MIPVDDHLTGVWREVDAGLAGVALEDDIGLLGGGLDLLPDINGGVALRSGLGFELDDELLSVGDLEEHRRTVAVDFLESVGVLDE